MFIIAMEYILIIILIKSFYYKIVTYKKKVVSLKC